MNKNQKIVLIVGIIIFVVIGINPPQYRWTSAGETFSRRQSHGGQNTDTGKLIGYWGSDIAICGVLIYLLKSTKKDDLVL